MSKMLTSAAVILALGVGMPALAADDTPLTTDAETQQSAPAPVGDETAEGPVPTDSGEAPQAAEGGMEMETNQPDNNMSASDTVGSGGASEEVDWSQYVGMPLMSDTGEELGTVSSVVAGAGGETLIIIERGGILGLGAKQYAMMPQDLRVDGGAVVAPMTDDQIAELPEYEAPAPTE